MPRALNVALVIVSVALVVVGAPWIFGLLSTSVSIGNSGQIQAVGVGVYSDYNCVNNVTEIQWGVIQQGAWVTFVVYIRNEGNTPATLSLTTDGWEPMYAADYITLSWSYGGLTLEPDDVVMVILTLSVSESVEGVTDFSFDIIITATE